MVKCSQCGFLNKSGTQYCINCGAALEITQEHLNAEKANQTTATKNYIGIFLVILGSCTLFVGLLTYATNMGAITQSITAQVASPCIIIGHILLVIGFVVLSVKPEGWRKTKRMVKYPQFKNIKSTASLETTHRDDMKVKKGKYANVILHLAHCLLIILGFSTLLGGLVTHFIGVGNIAQIQYAQLAFPYIRSGIMFLVIESFVILYKWRK